MSGVPAHLSAPAWSALKASVGQNVQWGYQARILDRAHELVAVLPTTTLEAQVNLDFASEIDRTLEFSHLDLDDQARTLLGGDFALRHYLQLFQVTTVPLLGPLSIPVFTGIPSTFSSRGPVFNLTAVGKESLWLAPSPTGVIHKGSYVVDAIAAGLRAGGERGLIDFPPSTLLGARVQKDIAFGGSDANRSRWKVWKKLARAAGYQLYVDGAGRYVIRPIPDGSEVTMEWGPTTLLTDPEFVTDLTTLRNRWVGQGAGTLQASTTVNGPYSPESLAVGVDKVPWSSTEFAGQNTSLTTQSQLLAAGRKRLNQLLALSTTVTCDVIPFHAVAPLDMCRVTTPNRTALFALKSASIPVVSDAESGEGAPMSIGTVKKVTRGKARRGRAKGRPPRKKSR